jgi:hypothetical protein
MFCGFYLTACRALVQDQLLLFADHNREVDVSFCDVFITCELKATADTATFAMLLFPAKLMATSVTVLLSE